MFKNLIFALLFPGRLFDEHFGVRVIVTHSIPLSMKPRFSAGIYTLRIDGF